MKTNLLRTGLRLSLLLMAFLWGGHLAQGESKVTHKVYTCVYGDATINCPAEIGDGEDLSFSATVAEENHLTFNITQDGGYHSFDGSGNAGVIKNVKGTIRIEAVVGGYQYIQDNEKYTYSVDQMLPATYQGLEDGSDPSKATIRNFLRVNGITREIWYLSRYHFSNATSLDLPPYISFGSNDSFLADCGRLQELHLLSPYPEGYTGIERAFGGKDLSGVILYVPSGSQANFSGVEPYGRFKEIREELRPGSKHAAFVIGEGVRCEAPDSVLHGETVSLRWTCPAHVIQRDLRVYMGGKLLDIEAKAPGEITIPDVTGDILVRVGTYLEYEDAGFRYEISEGKASIAIAKENLEEAEIPDMLATAPNRSYWVTNVGKEAFKDHTNLKKVTIRGNSALGDKSFMGCTALKEIYCKSAKPANVMSRYVFSDVDKDTCIVYVPAGAVEGYRAAYGWKEFKNIVEEGKEVTYSVTYDLADLTAYPQPATVKRDTTLAVLLIANEGYTLPDSILVNGKNTPAFYDKASGKVSIPNVRSDLLIKASALKSDTTQITKDETLTDVTVGVIDIAAGNNPADTAKVTMSGVTTSTTAVAANANAKLELSGRNDLGKVKNEGTLIISALDGAELKVVSVENNGTLEDETGTITDVTGTGALVITPVGDKAVEEGSSIDLTVSATPGEVYTSVTFQWQKLENGVWIDKQSRTVNPNPPARLISSLMRAAIVEPVTDSYMVSSSEASTFRCRIISKVNDNVSTTLTTISKVIVTSSEPVVISYNVILPSIEGATSTPSAGTYSVDEGGSFTFSLTLDTDYDQSKPIVKAGGTEIDPTSDGKYEIKNINSDITISITGIVRNTTVGNAEVDSDALRVWGANGVLHIRSTHTSMAYIVTFGGQLYKAVTLPVGETLITIPQGSYIINIGEQSYKIRF